MMREKIDRKRKKILSHVPHGKLRGFQKQNDRFRASVPLIEYPTNKVLNSFYSKVPL